MMDNLQADAKVVELERQFGTFDGQDGLFSLGYAMTQDEQDSLPQAAVEALLKKQVHFYYVPSSLGGLFHDADTFMQLGRIIARRNMSTAVSFSTMLWSFTAWISANDDIKNKFSHSILCEQAFPCLAYSEKAHGSDLTGNECSAVKTENGYCVSGEKWPINRATTAQTLVVLVRTDKEEHARNQTLFFIQKKNLKPENFFYRPRIKLYGLSGCDVSGIVFTQAPFSENAQIGAKGEGLEIALKAFQVTRTFCAALSLGAADTLLRIATKYIQQRILYQRPIADLPFVRSKLAHAYLAQLMSEAISLVGVRGLHIYTEQFSSWCSFIKVECTHLAQLISHTLIEVMGASFYTREGFMYGAFQKFIRDSAIVPIFDGSTPICLDSLATLLPSMIKARQKTNSISTNYDMPNYDILYNRSIPLKEIDLTRLNLFNRGRDAVHESVDWIAQALNNLLGNPNYKNEFIQEFISSFKVLQMRMMELDQAILIESDQRRHKHSAKMLHLAKEYIVMHRTLCCLGLWLGNRDKTDNVFFAEGKWAYSALQIGLTNNQLLNPELEEDLFQQLIQQVATEKMLSLLDWPVHQ